MDIFDPNSWWISLTAQVSLVWYFTWFIVNEDVGHIFFFSTGIFKNNLRGIKQ